MFNSKLRFPFPSALFLVVIVFTWILLSWSKACFLSFSLSCFLSYFPTSDCSLEQVHLKAEKNILSASLVLELIWSVFCSACLCVFLCFLYARAGWAGLAKRTYDFLKKIRFFPNKIFLPTKYQKRTKIVEKKKSCLAKTCPAWNACVPKKGQDWSEGVSEWLSS